MVSDDLVLFREQMLQFAIDTETALAIALEHPLVADTLQAHLRNKGMVKLPLPEEMRAALEFASTEELEQLRQAFAMSPGILSTPQTLITALQQLPQDIPAASSTRASCGDNYAEYGKLKSNKSTARGLILASNIAGVVAKGIEMVSDACNASSEDMPGGSKACAWGYGALMVADLIEQGLKTAGGVYSVMARDSEICLGNCLRDSDDLHAEGSEFWRGKGCDNRDNNCTGGMDEAAEDLFAPEIFVDSTIVQQCFPTEQEAIEASELAFNAVDDCSETSADMVVFSVLDTCLRSVTYGARDEAGNRTNVTSPPITVDEFAPIIRDDLLVLDFCYADLRSAREAFTGPNLLIEDCTEVQTSVSVVEKHCEADIEIEAIDECNHRSLAQTTLRVDGTAPDVDIEWLNIPSFEGLACFDSVEDAEATIAEATVFSDNCDSAEVLEIETTSDGEECNLVVTSSATDQCGYASEDSVTVRVDTEPPALACSVAEPILWPPDQRMVDIGYVLQVEDNCDESPDLDIWVTSDEATGLAWETTDNGGVHPDPHPDAIVERFDDGGIGRIQLRAERRQTNTSDYDGRVYRIRVVATDACGLMSEVECFVTVPPHQPDPGSAVNSGQHFDATLYN